MNKFLYILFSFFIISCCSLKSKAQTKSQKVVVTEQISNNLMAVLKNPNDLDLAQEMINNSGIRWEKLVYDNKGLKIGLIDIPKDKKDFWLDRLSKTGMFKEVKVYSKKALNEIVKREENILFSIRKTPCFGNCPSYNLIVNRKGKVTFIGEKYTLKDGITEFKLTDKEFEILNEKLKKKDFSQFEKIYTNPRIADLPSTFITYNGNQVHIRIWKNVPNELNAINIYIKQLLLNKKLIE